MNTRAMWGISIAVALIATAVVFTYSESLTQTAEAAKPTGLTERVSVTTQLENPGGGPAGVTVLLDTTGSGFLQTVHVAATLPAVGACAAGSPGTAPAGALTIVAGIAGVTIPAAPIVIIDGIGSHNTGFPGDAAGSCVYHNTVTAPAPMSITDVVILNGVVAGQAWVPFPIGTTVTVTGTYE